MSLLDEARALETRPGGICHLRRLRDERGAEFVEEIGEALEQGIQKAAICKALKARDVDIASETLRRHFEDKICKCWKANGQPV